MEGTQKMPANPTQLPEDICVLHIDRNQLFREGLRRILHETPFKILGEASSLRDGIDQIASLNPHLIIVDTNVTQKPSANCARESLIDLMVGVESASARARVVMLTDTVAIPRLANALGAGLGGYLLKDMSAEALKQSLQLVHLGETVFPTDLADLLINNRFVALGSNGSDGRNEGLSGRETEILSCLVNGHSNKAIANQLEITEGTVKVHLKGILKKIHVNNRTQAAIWAVQNGIVAEVNDG